MSKHIADILFTNTKFIKTTKKFFTFDVSTSIRGLHQKKLVLRLLLPVQKARRQMKQMKPKKRKQDVAVSRPSVVIPYVEKVSETVARIMKKNTMYPVL